MTVRSPTIITIGVVFNHLRWLVEDFCTGLAGLPRLYRDVLRHERAHARMRQVWVDFARDNDVPIIDMPLTEADLNDYTGMPTAEVYDRLLQEGNNQ